MRFIHALLAAAFAAFCGPVAAQTFDFETTFPDTFSNDALAPWATSTGFAHGGVRSLRSGTIPHYGSTAIRIPVTSSTGGVLTFWYLVDAESCCDPLEISVDGATPVVYYAQYPLAWRLATIEVPAGAREVVLRYRKDGSVVVGSDSVYIDDITMPSGPPSNTTVTFSWPYTDAGFGGASRVATVDATGDGIADLVGMTQRDTYYSGTANYWWVARWNGTAPVMAHVSRGYAETLYDLTTFTDPSGGRRLLVASDSRVYVYALPGYTLVMERALPAGVRRVRVADLDADGDLELVVLRNQYSYTSPIAVYPLAQGAATWSYTPAGSSTYYDDIEVADFTGDAGLEIAAGSSSQGVVLTAGGAMAWSYPLGFGGDLAAGNFDDDADVEFVGLKNGSIEMFDARLQSPLWGIANAGSGMVVAKDVSGDGRDEAIVSTSSSYARVRAYSPVTRLMTHETAQVTHGGGVLAVDDLDGNGVVEVATTSNYSDSQLSVLRFGMPAPDWTSGTVSSATLIDDLRLADAEGDGSLEVLSADSTALYVSDAGTLARERRIPVNATSQTSYQVRGFDAAQLDVDPAQELVAVVADYYYSGPYRLEVYDAATGTRQANLTITGLTSAPTHPHVVGGDRAWVVVGDRVAEIRLSDGVSTWSSVSLSSYNALSMTTANLDADPQAEAVVLSGANVVVFDTTTRLVEWIEPVSGAISLKVDAALGVTVVTTGSEVRLLDVRTRQNRVAYTNPLQNSSLRNAWVTRVGTRAYLMVVRGDHTTALLELDGRPVASAAPHAIGFGEGAMTLPYVVGASQTSIYGVSNYALHRFDVSIETPTLFGDGFE